ncbi:MAG: aminotransferase class IV [Phycisphaerales bacterium]
MSYKVFFNTEIVDSSEARISCQDSGFLYGAGLFEVMRASNGIVFALDEHLDKLINSSIKLQIQLRGDKKYLADAVYETLNANGLKEARVRITVSSGAMATEKPEPTLLVSVSEFNAYPKEYYDKGILVVLNSYRQNPADVLSGHQTTSYFSRLMALAMAHQKRAAEALWFTVDHRLAEGCLCNVFIVKNSVLFTPSLKINILPGIARKTVLKLSAENSIKFEEKDLSINELLDSDEVFVTNVTSQIVPVVSIEAHNIGNSKPGTITKKIMELYTNFFNKSVGL